MRVLIAPDKFRGALDAASVAKAMAEGVRRAAGPTTNIQWDLCPMSDGGEGFLDAMMSAVGNDAAVGNQQHGHYCQAQVIGPRADEPMITAKWGMITSAAGHKTAVVEMALASGLALLPRDLRNPLKTTTFGTGQLLLEAAKAGAEKILLGIGGSATVDMGVGCCQAVGHTVLDRSGEGIDPHSPITGGDLHTLSLIKRGRGSLLDRIPIQVACDVENPLLGPNGSAAVFGPQKGATRQDVAYFDAEMARLVKACHAQDLADTPGAGAAGGMGFAMLAFFNAELVPGFGMIADAVNLEARMQKANWVLTGEGSFDRQSLSGKTAVGVARMAKQLGKPCVVLAGKCSVDAREAAREGITAAFGIESGPMSIADAIRNTGKLLSRQAENVARLMDCRNT